MPVRFYTPDRTIEVECLPQLNLLAHAQLVELEIGSRCGGHGICGGDRIQIKTQNGSVSPMTDVEQKHLTEQEIHEGWRLACQCFPETDGDLLDIVVPVLQLSCFIET